MNQEINQTTPPQQEEATGFNTNEMFTRIVDFFRPPVFEDDPEKTRVARLLNLGLVTLLVMFIILPIVSFILGRENRLPLYIGSTVMMAIVISGLVAIRRGVVRRTATILVLFIFFTIVIFAGIIGQGANNLALLFLPLVIYLAAFLIGPRAGIIFGVLSFLELFGIYAISEFAELPVMMEIQEGNYYSVMALLIITFSAIVVAGSLAYQRSFERTEKAEAETRKNLEELAEIRTYLEEEVAENTRQLERRSRHLEAAAKVAGASISTQNLDEMLENVVNEVSQQFNFFHVGIFMLDEQKEWAALRAASSEGGKRMIARNHRLAVGRQGIVGYVTSLGQGRISQDTGGDRVHEPAEELPETRSEMALPLISRGEIIGALDIQDTKPEAFVEDDINVLQTMADQVALAIENIRLYAQTQETLVEVQRLFGDYSQQAWHDVHQKNLLSSYRYFSGAVTKVDGDESTEMTESTASIPVEVRGVNLGTIEISKGEDDAKWSDDELKLLNSLSEQLGIALDSARLFNESQLRATTEHAISEINSQLWETMDINAILRTTAANLRETLALPELTIRMASPEDESEASSNGNLEIDEIEVND